MNPSLISPQWREVASGPGATPAMCLAASACAFFLGHIPAFAGWISEVRLIPLRVSSIHAAARQHEC